MDIGTIIGGILTGGTGGLLGILGNCANVWLSMKKEKQDHEYQLALIPLQLNADIERTKAEVAKVQEAGAAAGFVASQQADAAISGTARWVSNIRALIRPSCLFLLFCVVICLYTAGELTVDMKAYIIQNVVTDFSMAVAWYFGARATALVMQGFKSKAGT